MQHDLALFPATDFPASALPRDERGLLDWVRLARSHRVGAQTFLRLMREHGDAAAALAALPGVASAAGVARYTPCPEDVAARELERGRKAGARILPLGAPDYPAPLANIPDPPAFIWVRGRLPAADRPSVSLVGARNASALGMRMAAHLATTLGEAGAVTVSGLARGIDTAVHKASAETGTIAVLAGGADMIYPPENAALAESLLEQGCLISEMPPGLQAQARHFPRRNRIISGLAAALVVVEGAMKSGSLITARAAADQGREIMAVPGHPFDARAAGCNMLIRDGATLVRSAQDILESMSVPLQVAKPVPAAAPTPAAPATAPAAALQLPGLILNMLGPAPISEDALIRQLHRPTQEVLAALASLDIAGRVQRHPGGLVSGTGQPP